MKSREQGFLNKECVAMHTNYFEALKQLYTPVP